MINKVSKNQNRMEGFKFDRTVEYYMDRYSSDLKFLVPWVQYESYCNKKTDFRKDKTSGNVLKKKKFIEFIEANTI